MSNDPTSRTATLLGATLMVCLTIALIMLTVKLGMILFGGE
jgi:hypothetical protein